MAHGMLFTSVVAGMLMFSTFAAYAVADARRPVIEYGPELIVNGSFDRDAITNNVPDNWEWNVQTRGDKGTLRIRDAGRGSDDRCVEIRFEGPNGIQQARIMQFVSVEPGKVYELSFRYLSAADARLHADVLLTGTGPMYRSIFQVPSSTWTHRRVLFHVPESIRDQKPADEGKAGSAGIYVQNRSVVPIRYDDLSLRQTNLTEEQLSLIAPDFVVQPRSMADQLIFPDTTETHAIFLANLSIPEDIDASDHWTISPVLLLPGGAVRSLDEVSPDDLISIPIDELPVGETTLAVQLRDAESGDVLGVHRQAIERIDASEFSGRPDLAEPAIFRDRDGEPFFPIIMFGVSRNFNDNIWREVRDAGFNTIHDYNFEGRGKPDEVQSYLDRAENLGLRVMTGLPRDLAEDRGRHSELREWLKQFRDHPATLFYFADEMVSIRHTPLSTVDSVTQLIRDMDPDRRFLVYDKPEIDVVSRVDGLVAGISSPSFATLVRLRLGDDKPYISCFGQSHVRSDPGPDALQLRYEMFMPVILGARGISYWMYPRARWHRSDDELLSRVMAAAGELSQVAPAVISTDPVPEGVIATVTGEAYKLVCTKEDETYVLAGAPQDGEGGGVSVQVPSHLHASLLFEDDTLEVLNSGFELDVPAGRVRLIKLTPVGRQ